MVAASAESRIITSLCSLRDLFLSKGERSREVTDLVYLDYAVDL